MLIPRAKYEQLMRQLENPQQEIRSDHFTDEDCKDYQDSRKDSEKLKSPISESVVPETTIPNLMENSESSKKYVKKIKSKNKTPVFMSNTASPKWIPYKI